MTFEEKTRKTLAELGVADAAGVQTLFAKARDQMEAERQAFARYSATDQAEHERLAKQLRDRWLARKNGLISFIDEHWLKEASKELRPAVGKHFNELRKVSAALEVEELRKLIPLKSSTATGAKTPVVSGHIDIEKVSACDLTLPGYRRPLGSIHPVTQVMREIEEIFLGLGFWIESGPEIESVYYNFDALNIPESHPARDDWDTLYINSGAVLRTHTSPVQIRAMEKHGAPLHIICPGKCYRRDNPDSTHATMFHQVEGLAVDTDISFADLKGTLEFFTKRFFGESVKTSFHPSFFPFTEPSAEVAISCVFCQGEGCGVCKMSGWLEVMGCGMVHPEVLRHGHIDPERYSGWAFGLGVERFAMIKYNINDIQLFYQSDVRFLEQF